MGQITIKLPDSLEKAAEMTAEEEGYMNISEFARNAVREQTPRSNLIEAKEDGDGS